MKIFLTTLSIILFSTGCKIPLISKDDEPAAEVAAPSVEAPAPTGGYLYVASGFPTLGSDRSISKWNSDGNFISEVYRYLPGTNLYPQSLTLHRIAGALQLLVLPYNGTSGRAEIMSLSGANPSTFIDNVAAISTGSRRIKTTSDGGFLITRAAGVEKFNSSLTRVGTTPRYTASGTCVATALMAGVEAIPSAGNNVVITANAAASTNNKINFYNAATGACLAGAVPAGPATTLWPVDMVYDSANNKLYVLYYPYTAATSNAQIWSFTVGASALSSPTLVYNDVGGDISIINTSPHLLSSAIEYTTADPDGAEVIYVGTAFNSVLKLVKQSGVWTKWRNDDFASNSQYLLNVSSVLFVPNE